MDDNTAQFVCDLNVKRFAEKLQSERDPDMRMSLKKLLIEEEDKFAQSVERLDKVRRHIDEGNQRISSQKSLIERLSTNDHDTRLAERTLGNLVEIQRLFEEYYHKSARSFVRPSLSY
jgi:hypothetical protein